MQEALDSFVREHARKDTLIVLLWDRAGFHQTENLHIPEGIEVFPLPPYTPELQPAERLWPSLREAVANRWIRSLDHLESLLTHRIRALMQTPETIQALTGYDWILDALKTTN